MCMYIENIYEEWKLHHDATQLEINYNFLVKFIDILDVDVLLKRADEIVVKVQDKEVIREWKIFQINKLLEQYKEISNYDFNGIKSLNHSKIFIKSIFIAGYILNTLKNTNYKASELNSLYEPKLFTYAEKYLNFEILEEWISMLSKRIFEQNINNLNNTNLSNLRAFNWSISTASKSLKNVTWYIENLLINFNDITIWINKVKIDDKVFKAQKSRIINIMNHMIVYCLTDFYAKYYTEITNDKYLKVYQDTLNKIAIDVHNHTFAIISFKQISSFLNFLLNKKIINTDDVMVTNFLNFINICCSENNIRLLKTILLNINEKVDDVTYDHKIDVYHETDEGVPNQDTNPIELDSFENYKTYKTTLLEPEITANNKQIETVEINEADEIPIVSYKTMAIDDTTEYGDKTNSEDVANIAQTEKTSILKNITKPLHTFKNMLGSNTQKISNNSEYKQNTKQTIETNLVQEEVDEYE